MQAFYSDNFVLPLPPGHRFPMAKYQLLRDALTVQLPQVEFVQAPAAVEAELAFAHHPAYIAAIANGSVDAKICLLYTSPSPRDLSTSRMPSSA